VLLEEVEDAAGMLQRLVDPGRACGKPTYAGEARRRSESALAVLRFRNTSTFVDY